MTIANTNSRNGPYTLDGVTTNFAYTFKALDSSQVQVIQTVSGVDTTLALNTDYTLTGVGLDAGGNVVLNTPLSTGTLTILLNPTYLQTTVLNNNSPYFAKVIEAALDLAAQRVIKLLDKLGRSPTLDDSDVDGSGAYLAKGNRISNLGTPSVSTDAVTKAYVDSISVAAGNVPAPGAGNIGKWLKATSATVWAWTSIVINDITNASTDAKTLLAHTFTQMRTDLSINNVDNTSDITKRQAFPACSVHRNGAGAVATNPANNPIKVNMVTFAANNGSFTSDGSGGVRVPANGLYMVWASGQFSNIAASSSAFVGVAKNGTILNFGTMQNLAAGASSVSNVAVALVQISAFATDSIQFYIQGSNTANALNDAQAHTHMEIVQVALS